MPNDVLKEILSVLTDQWFGLIFFCSIIFAFIFFVAEIIVRKFFIKNLKAVRVVFGVLFLSNIFILISSALIDGIFTVLDKTAICLFVFSISVAMYILAFPFSNRQETVCNEHKNLIDALDKKIKEEKEERKGFEISGDCEESADEFDEINFSHVKNVINRLKLYPVQMAEKKQVEELNLLIKKAEESVMTPNLKAEINEKLSMLLKIMAKYNV